jgi:transcriptional regulator with GAF, ATPase, and Fis domain
MNYTDVPVCAVDADASIRESVQSLIRADADSGPASDLDEIVGSSRCLQHVLAQVRKVAPTDATVLIAGETGTGKELIACGIHKLSRRRGRAFVAVNCAAISPSLISSELFGHERGAFTGALQRRKGRFELAEGGTLFLDEIGELPEETQIALLRVLQEREFERVGGTQTVSANVRVIAATHRNLEAAIREGRFRADLYYRLNVIPIAVPPLRERREDIPALVHQFIREVSQSLGTTIDAVPPATIEALQSYDWPGNVRELRNVIERAVILAQDGEIEFHAPQRNAPPAARPQPPRHEDGDPQFLTEAEMRSYERENLLAVLEKTRWKIKGCGGAAELLGVKATTLMSRMHAMGLKRGGWDCKASPAYAS